MPARTSPENGDVLVNQETRDGTVVYILRPLRAPISICSALGKTLSRRR